MKNKEHNILNLMFLFHYKYSRQKNNPLIYAMFDAILYFDLPFLLLLIGCTYAMDKFLKYKFLFNLIGDLNFWPFSILIAIPLALILKLLTYNKKTSESISLSNIEYKKGKKVYFIFLAIVALLTIIPPFIFGGG